MDENKSGLPSRRQALRSLIALTAGTLIRPASIFGAAPVKNRLRISLLGDWGTGDDDGYGIARQITQAHRTNPLDFIIGVGDNIYPDGSGRHFAKKFEEPFSALLREQMKFYTVLGNHDVKDGREAQCNYSLFNMNGHCYYTLKQGDGLAEFFMLDSTDFDAAQTGWLEGALRASTARWKIPVFHHPIYSSGKSHGSAVELRKTLEPLFTRYGVRAVFSGHDHIYERTKPQQGIQYFVSGGGGKVRRGGTDLNSPFTAKSYDADNHFMQIEIDDRQISFQAISESGQVVDSGVIEKSVG